MLQKISVFPSEVRRATSKVHEANSIALFNSVKRVPIKQGCNRIHISRGCLQFD